MKIFIVLHHEIMNTSNCHRADEMVFYTASSMEESRGTYQESGSQSVVVVAIQSQDLDSNEWPEHVGYYGLRGGKLAKPPYDKCVEIFKKECHQ